MTKTVWKYPIKGGEVALPEGAKIIHVAHQPDVGPMLWAEVPYNERYGGPDGHYTPTSTVQDLRSFVVIGTGFPIEESMAYVGTWLDPPYVWHLYERKAKR